MAALTLTSFNIAVVHAMGVVVKEAKIKNDTDAFKYMRQNPKGMYRRWVKRAEKIREALDKAHDPKEIARLERQLAWALSKVEEWESKL